MVLLDWPRNQLVTKEEIEKVPSWQEKGTKLLHKKVRYLIAILSLATDPVKLDTLMAWIGYSNRNTFRNNYLLPLQQAGLLAMTNPEKPKDPEQKYYLTESGKLFLTGRNI
jgi:ATP-dependent DNA helicase RecG